MVVFDLPAVADQFQKTRWRSIVVETIMRTLLPAVLLSVLTLFPNPGSAGDRLPQLEVLKSEKPHTVSPTEETYRGYVSHLSAIAGRKDFNEIVSALQHQLDIVESVGLSPRVLNFFRSVPIVAEELACLANEVSAAACYERSGIPMFGAYVVRANGVWDSAKSQWINSNQAYSGSDSGVVLVRPSLVSNNQNPVMLHELLHAFHAQIMPQGFQNEGILFHYNLAKKSNTFIPRTNIL
jgi:hypothetical protein